MFQAKHMKLKQPPNYPQNMNTHFSSSLRIRKTAQSSDKGNLLRMRLNMWWGGDVAWWKCGNCTARGSVCSNCSAENCKFPIFSNHSFLTLCYRKTNISLEDYYLSVRDLDVGIFGEKGDRTHSQYQ